jgi:hypothetical protein
VEQKVQRYALVLLRQRFTPLAEAQPDASNNLPTGLTSVVDTAAKTVVTISGTPIASGTYTTNFILHRGSSNIWNSNS